MSTRRDCSIRPRRFPAHLASAALIAFAAAEGSSAHDLLPPPFRGAPGSTFQAWEFNTPALGLPDGECAANNPIGPALASGVGNAWFNTFPAAPPNLQGVQCLPLGSALIFVIPNFNDPTMVKTVWVQVVFHPHAGSSINVTVTEPGGSVPFLLGTQDLPVPGHPTWIHRTFGFCFDLCPPQVTVTLTGAYPPGCLPNDCHVDIDQVIIDTTCAPFWVPPPPPAAPGDFDGDGIGDLQDNAPGVANPNQVDCDCDGFGNVSDLWGICPVGTPPEFEPCGFDVNGGCNSVPNAFQQVTCGSAVCGTAWASGGVRDTDWYAIDLPDADGDGFARLRVDICSALPVVGFILDDNCANIVTLAQTVANADMTGCLTACLPAPATYWIFIAPGTLAGPILFGFPCNTANEYLLDIDCFEPCGAGGQCACLWDLDGNGVVGIVNFFGLLGAWGPNPGHPADFNCDGVVDVLDFLELLSNWGSCP